MKNIFLTCFIIFISYCSSYSQIPDTAWTKTFGGPLADVGNSVKQTTDGGFIIAATTSSFGTGGQDIYLIKTDENGDTLWTKTFGGTGNDRAANVVQTNDNGYAVFGTTNSFGNGGDDFLLWKTDSLGNTAWFKTYGGSGTEGAFEGQGTLDNGYILTGYFQSQDTKGWVVRTNDLGEEMWAQTIGDVSTTSYHASYSVQQADDSTFFIAGIWYYWFNGSYRYNYFLSKLNTLGNSIFYHTYERNGADRCWSVRKTIDGNLVLGGNSGSTPFDTFPWIVKVNSSGNILWQKIISGSQMVGLIKLEPTNDNGFIITVTSLSGPPTNDNFQIWKTDDVGTLLWEKSIGGTIDDRALSAMQTNDSGYIIIGKSNSFGYGDYDAWLVRLETTSLQQISIVYPNGGEYWLMGDTVDIKWNSISVDSIKIQLSLNNGNDWITIVDSTPSDSVYEWIVQAPQTSWDCKIRISDIIDSTVYDESDTTFVIDIFPSVQDSTNTLPIEFSLGQNFPNPFNPTTKIKFTLSLSLRERVSEGQVRATLKVYDVLGNEIATLVNEEKQPGTYEVEFDGTNLPSGIYFYQLRVGGPEINSPKGQAGQAFIETKKMLLLK